MKNIFSEAACHYWLRFNVKPFWLCLSVLVFLACSAWAQNMNFAPINNHGEGEIKLQPFHGITSWAADQKFTSFAGAKFQSDNGSYNFVIPVNGSVNELAGFSDIDYLVSGSGSNLLYTEYPFNSIYTFSFPGDPSEPVDYVANKNAIQPNAIFSRGYTGVPTGNYSITCHVVENNSIEAAIDTPVNFEYNLYVVDFEEQEREINSLAGVVIPISLKCIPYILPNSSSLNIDVSWSGTSCLYSDYACTMPITGQSGQTKKSWDYLQAPSVIYFKRPANDTAAHTITLGLRSDSVTSAMLTTDLSFVTPSGTLFMRTVKAGKRTGTDLRGFWDLSVNDPKDVQEYPNAEWQDKYTPYDGSPFDTVNMYYAENTEHDYNRPFVYSVGGSFVVHGGTIRHNDNITYSNSDYKVVASSSNGLLNESEASITSDTGTIITFGEMTGGTFSKISAGNVVISWKLVNRHTGAEIPIGDTQHFVYVIGGTASRPYHTLVDIGCRAASGSMSLTNTRDSIWNALKGLDLYRYDGGSLIYDPAGSYTDTTYSQLLYLKRGNPKMWARLMEQVYTIQGASCYTYVVTLGEGNEGVYDDDGNSISIVDGNVKMNGTVVGTIHMRQRALLYQGGVSGASVNNRALTKYFYNAFDQNERTEFYDVTCGHKIFRGFGTDTIELYYKDSNNVEHTISGYRLDNVNLSFVVML